MKNVLAVDIGASSGRAIMGEFDGTKISLRELHRFDNTPVMLRGTFYWDILALFNEIKTGIALACRQTPVVSVGIDTWGVDFGLLDKRGNLMQNPVHYRDTRTDGAIEAVCEIIGKDRLYYATGIQFMNFNTLFQLYALRKQYPDIYENACGALLTPDLLGYFLTGEKTSEFSIASTTQMMNPYTREWNTGIMGELGIPAGFFPPVVSSGILLGSVTGDIQEELGLKDKLNVVSVAGHDTASAVVAVPAKDEDYIYISCGTWSLLGTELAAPLINEKSLSYDITNEGGYGNKTLFLKNIIGLWLIQETRRQYAREGVKYSYNDLEQLSLKAKPFRYLVDPDAPEFGLPGDIPGRIRKFCQKTGQGVPETVGEIVRCIYESLALKYRHACEQIQDCTGKTYRRIHMIGGGTKDRLLCDMTAAATNCKVIAGPIEATALGNIAVQLIAEGEIKDMNEVRTIISSSVQPVIYEPEDHAVWDAAYKEFVSFLC